MKDELPEIEYATRYNDYSQGIFRYGEKVFNEKLIAYVDSDFFKMFSFRLISGNADKLFKTKSEVVLTPEIAEKYFGDEDPIGKTVLIEEVEEEGGEKSFSVAGVIETPPANSSLSFQILLPQENRPYYDHHLNRWDNFNTYTLIRLVPNTDLSKLNANLDKVMQKYLGKELEKWRKEYYTAPIPADVKQFALELTRLPEFHLKKEINWNKVSDPQYSFILGGIALLILLIACINYISLALTTSATRRTEVGIRKVVGAQWGQLVYQFGFESLILVIISIVMSIGLVVLFLPAFNQFTGKGISLDEVNLFRFLALSVAITMVVSILSGSYPALFLAGLRPALVLKGGFTSRLQAGFTRPLVVLQFALSAFLIISSMIMFRQMRFVTTKNLGYDKDQILVVPTQPGWNEKANKVVEHFRAKMDQESSIVSVSGTNASFNGMWSRFGYKLEGEHKEAYVYTVDPYYIPTLGLEIIAGRNFDSNIASDTNALIVNEALVRDMKWKDPLNAHLNWMRYTVGLRSTVIGVVKDYHFLSLEKRIEPMFLTIDMKTGYTPTMLVKLQASNIPDAIEKVRSVWLELNPDKPFEYTFLDQDVAKQYESRERWMSIMGLSTGFAVLISCLGLFGLAGINAVNRTKEIGIRKVMGAELSNIFVLLNKQYVWLALIAFVIAAPASWYIMNKWLADFQFKITISWELFVLSMGAGLIIALATVSYHAIKAALINPAETLKYE